MRDYNSVFENLENRKIWFQREQSEYSNEVADFFSDIFSVTIDRKVSFIFVPNFTLSNFDRIEINYSDENAIKNKNEARIHTLLKNNYIITPNQEKKNTVEKISFGFSEYPFDKEPTEKMTVLYYVSSEEFNKFQNEYDSYFEIWHLNSEALEESKILRNMIKYNFIEFIIKNVITSDYFTDRDYEWVISGNK
jgi:hypothetical protein